MSHESEKPEAEEDDFIQEYLDDATSESAEPAFVEGGWQLDKTITLEQLEQEFTTQTQMWQGGEYRQELFELLDSHAPTKGWQFDKVVSLGTVRFARQMPRETGEASSCSPLLWTSLAN